MKTKRNNIMKIIVGLGVAFAMLLSIMGLMGMQGCDITFPTTEREITADDFELLIFIERTTLAQGEAFNVEAKLKNLSGRDIEIAYLNRPGWLNNTVFWPYMPYSTDTFEELQEPFLPGFITILNNEYYFELMQGGALSDLIFKWFWTESSGAFQFRVRAIFSVNFGKENQQDFEIWSNPVELTIIRDL